VNQQRICHIHAGTHKTASTYIQSRLYQNRRLLARHQLIYEFPARAGLKHKPLVAAANKDTWKRWHHYLDRYTSSDANLLLSAEQFTRPLCNPERLSRIVKILTRHGYSLHVLIFVRPQLDYMNSRYVHTLRRLYHSLSFEEYVSSFTSLESGDIYNYGRFFRPLLDAGIRCTFLPFSRQYGDPFLQLTSALGLENSLRYAPAAPGSENVQPGSRGVWLSRLVVERLEKLGHNGHDLKNTSQVVRRIAERQGWHEERYFGFSEELAASTLRHYQADNEAFAQIAWKRSWDEVFPPQSSNQSIYEPADPEEARQMKRLADQIVDELASRNPKLAKALRASA
jgi:hypothetical protein